MKKFVALMLVGAMSLSIAACGTTTKEVGKAQEAVNKAGNSMKDVVKDAAKDVKDAAENVVEDQDFNPATYWDGHEKDAFYNGNFVMTTEAEQDGVTVKIYAEVEGDTYKYFNIGMGDFAFEIAEVEGSTYLVSDGSAYTYAAESDNLTTDYDVTSEIENMTYVRTEHGMDYYTVPGEEGEDAIEVTVDRDKKAVVQITQGDVVFTVTELTEKSFEPTTLDNVEEISEDEAAMLLFGMMMGGMVGDVDLEGIEPEISIDDVTPAEGVEAIVE